MAWALYTTDSRQDGIFGELYQNGELFGVTLEHAYEDIDNDTWLPKLLRGATYTCRRGMHRLEHYNKGEPFETFEVMNVPGHSGILLHVGNFNRDSDGCILLGVKLDRTNADWWITESRTTFAKFMKALDGVDEFELEVN